VTTFYMQL